MKDIVFKLILFTERVILSILKFFANDKNLVILTTSAIALISMYCYGKDSREIVQCVITGLFGIAVGRHMSSRENDKDKDEDFEQIK